MKAMSLLMSLKMVSLYSVTPFTASPEFVEAVNAFKVAGDLLELKVEVIAIEASGNKAIAEETLFEVD
jgi:hypothetical protein